MDRSVLILRDTQNERNMKVFTPDTLETAKLYASELCMIPPDFFILRMLDGTPITKETAWAERVKTTSLLDLAIDYDNLEEAEAKADVPAAAVEPDTTPAEGSRKDAAVIGMSGSGKSSLIKSLRTGTAIAAKFDDP
ncbi:MAG: hypothetical protein V2I33_17155 [Kangiellaceae bacterium]|jgi:ribosome biogenesis GTPase A|nr:hypothetical protein [Kangiellaceae bacterium]